MQKQIIKKLKTSDGCACPECYEPVYETVMMPIGKMTEFGLIEFPNGKKETGTCSLCKHHYCFAEHNIINLINQNNVIVLIGPWPIIDVFEGMLKAKEMFKKLNKKSRKKCK